MKYLCLYYSATGNTERAVELVKRGLEAEGSHMDEVEVRKGAAAPRIEGYDRLLVAFPVLAFSPPVFVTRFLRTLPLGAGMRACVLAVDAGGGGSAAAVAARVLRRRGYRVTVSARASYADNWTQLVQPGDRETRVEMTRVGDAMVAGFLRALRGGQAADNGRRSIMDAIVGFLFGVFGRRFLGKMYFADDDCNACGKCVKRCPASAIVLEKGRHARPYWKASCEDCNACVNRCPKNAVVTSVARLAVLLAAITGFLVLGIRLYSAYLRPPFAALIPAALATVVDVVAVTAIVGLAHVLGIGPFDAFILKYLQRVPGIRKLFAWSFMKNWRRYIAEPVEN